MTEIEREFVAVAQETFGFLSKEYGLREEVIETPEDVRVSFSRKTFAVEIIFITEEIIDVHVIKLENGRIANPFDEAGDEHFTFFSLDRFLEIRDPLWKRPAIAGNPRDAASIRHVLLVYAQALRANGRDVLTNTSHVFREVEARLRSEGIAEGVEAWADFVEQVQRGFDGSITDYVEAITKRAQLEALLRKWRGDRSGDSAARQRLRASLGL